MSIALADALKEKKIAGAAIDVYQTEPPPKDHPLFGLENVVLTPHLGASTDEAQTAVSRRRVQGDRRVPEAAARSAAR